MANPLLIPFLIFLLLIPFGNSWGWFSTSSSTDDNTRSENNYVIPKGFVSEFSLEALNDPKAVELVDNARRKLGGSNPCWFSAYQSLFSSCSEIFAAEEKRSRLAWHLSDCFQKDTGRTPFPFCEEKSRMVDCLRKLNNDDHKTYLEFYLETNAICHQLQSKAFKLQVESLVNSLKTSAQFAQEKLNSIEEHTNHLQQTSSSISNTLTSIDIQTQETGDTLKNMKDELGVVLMHSKELNDTANGIALAQEEILEGQGRMREKLEEDMGRVFDSYREMGVEIEGLMKKALQVEEMIRKFEEGVGTGMEKLQGKAEDIAGMAGVSLDKQEEVLHGQAKAIEGLQSLTNFQSQALEESRVTLQQLLEFAHGQHQELVKQQEQLLQAHHRLANSSNSILQAQEAFERKQASMFAALDKLFALQKAMLMESRLLKAFFVYSILIIILYLFTSAKETYPVRCRLYIGLCVSFALECGILRLTGNEMEHHKSRLTSMVKPVFGVYAVSLLVYSIFTFRDYETMNHRMLLTLMEKINGMQKRQQDLSFLDNETDTDVDWRSWVDSDLPEDVDLNEDPDFTLPNEFGTDLILANMEKRYNLRRRF